MNCRQLPTWALRLLLVSLTVLSLFSEGHSQAQEARTWTDSTGKQKTVAEFVKMEGDNVTLRKPGTDKTVTLPFDRLSDEDQVYIEDLLDELEEKRQAEERTRRQRAESQETNNESKANDPELPAKNEVDRDSAADNSLRTVPNNVVNSVRGAVFRTQTQNNLRQIATAIALHESTKGRFPTAAMTARDGKPLLSWRVAILPMLEEQSLYNQFRLNEPWDSEHNKALVDRMPKVFESPGSDLGRGYTNYLAVAGSDTVLAIAKRGARMNDIRDGTSTTLMLVEVDDTHAAIWTRPSEYVWDVDRPMQGLGGIWPSYFMGAFADARVSRIDTSLDRATLNGMVTRAGGERIQLDLN